MNGTGRNVVGGDTASGVGVAGFLLGGGYSLRSNKYGLGIDNIIEMEVVIPNGEIKIVNESREPRLFKALKGGGNNFGIVTRFRLATYPQEGIWGSTFKIEGLHEQEAKDAIDDFLCHEDRPEAGMYAAFQHYIVAGELKYSIVVTGAYDGCKPCKDPWKRFEELVPHTTDDLAGRDQKNGVTYVANKSVEMTSYTEVCVMASEALGWDKIGTKDARGRFGCIMVNKYNRALIEAAATESKNVAGEMKSHQGKLAMVKLKTFMPSIFNNSKPSAWPHKQGEESGPFLVYFLWEGPENDEFWLKTMQTALGNLQKVACEAGCVTKDAPVYLNTTLETTTAQEIYRDELEELRLICKEYDPDNVMGRTGGFKIPLPPKVT